MAETGMTGAVSTIQVKVELFGTPRIQSGRSELELLLQCPVQRQDLVQALAEACPQLVGHGVRTDLSDVEEGYVFNLNGLSFLGEGDFTLEDGDSILLISSQAGG